MNIFSMLICMKLERKIQIFCEHYILIFSHQSRINGSGFSKAPQKAGVREMALMMWQQL